MYMWPMAVAAADVIQFEKTLSGNGIRRAGVAQTMRAQTLREQKKNASAGDTTNTTIIKCVTSSQKRKKIYIYICILLIIIFK